MVGSNKRSPSLLWYFRLTSIRVSIEGESWGRVRLIKSWIYLCWFKKIAKASVCTSKPKKYLRWQWSFIWKEYWRFCLSWVNKLESIPVMTISTTYTSKRTRPVGVLHRNNESNWLWTNEKRSEVGVNFSNHAWKPIISHKETNLTYTQWNMEKKINLEEEWRNFLLWDQHEVKWPS